MKIVFATNNAHKLSEVQQILGDKIQILSLNDIGCHVDIPETGSSLQENAHLKASYVFEKYGYDCFADDTGLEVEALHGAPGVHSARYAEGTDHDSEANMRKLLKELDGVQNRKARFRTVIALIQHEGDSKICSREYEFEGIVNGRIDTQKHGTEGFGYDPLFIPDGYDESFAQLGEDVKNQISHRARAVKELCEFLTREE